jgi:membrane-bound lytic murein transglycosylase D
MKDLNAELVLGYIPRQIDKYEIRIPKGSGALVANYVQNRGHKSGPE